MSVVPGVTVPDAVVEGMSGGAASIVALLATYPLKTIYTIQALSGTKDAKVLSILQIIQKYRLGLYVGIEPNMVESAISSSVYFYLYSFFRGLVPGCKQQAGGGGSSKGGKPRDMRLLESIVVASLAGCGNMLVTLPASVVVTRMQVGSAGQAHSMVIRGGCRPCTIAHSLNHWVASSLGAGLCL